MSVRSAREFLIWRDVATYQGAGFAAHRHSHFSVQICLPAAGKVRLRGRDGQWRAYDVALVPPGVSHELAPVAATGAVHDGADFVIIHLDPLTVGRGLFADRTVPRDHPAVEIGDLVTETDKESLFNALREPSARIRDQVLKIFAPHAQPESRRDLDPRIRSGIERLNASPEHVSLRSLADDAGLSMIRDRHLFRETIGTPLSSYRLWLKTNATIRHLASGAPLVNAAYECGFADQAHFSRIFRRTFGMNPSAFRKGEDPFTVRFFGE